jgi:uncharacterized membrane protein YsdA (DUF1294 family)
VRLFLLYLLVGNVVTFALFGLDKRRARAGSQRISEATLVGSAALTGTVGGWLGMHVFRHKTAKRSFQAKMLLATALDVVILVLILR